MSDYEAGALEAYREAQPTSGPNWGWNLYGTGVESVGRAGGAEDIPLAPLSPSELLVRVDAVGMCFSDVKLLQQGGNHPKLYGRDLAEEPTRLGHEATVTVLEVGSDLRDQYRTGQRLAVQPDIYQSGRATAYGYTIPGGMVRRHLVGDEILAADDGSYVIDLDDRLGYAAAALSEPWACVEAAYTQRRRLDPLTGGNMWIVGRSDDPVRYQFSSGLDEPRRIVLTDVPPQVVALVEQHRHPQAIVEVRNGASSPLNTSQAVRQPSSLSDSESGQSDGPFDGPLDGPFDDIVLLDPRSAALVTEVARKIAFRGTLNLVGQHPLDGLPDIDMGRIHYDYTAYLGNQGPDIAGSYGPARNRCDLVAGGVTVVIGAGPMGQMHVQRALEATNGPSAVIVSDLDAGRLDALTASLGALAVERGRVLTAVDASAHPDGLRQAVAAANSSGSRPATPDDVTIDVSIDAAADRSDRLAGGAADDVIVTVPSAHVMSQAAQILASDGMLVLFAGVPNGTCGPLDLSRVYLHGAQFTGTSGSKLSDQRRVIERAVRGELSPQRSLAAIGGIEAARDGITAMIEGKFAGKIVIFPQLAGLPLVGLDELADHWPSVAAKLDDGSWTTEAEVELISLFWDRDDR